MKDLSKFAFIASEIMLAGIFFTLLDFAHGDSDISLVAKSIKDSMNLKIEKLEIKGESYREICPSGQCKVDHVVDNYTYFLGPRSEFKAIAVTFDFSLEDNGTNADVGPKKKDFNEHFTTTTFCNIGDNIEENGRGVYTCHDGSASIIRKSDQKSWELDSINLYDKRNRTVNIIGNLTGGIHKQPPSIMD
jgi:hypothetical protein